MKKCIWMGALVSLMGFWGPLAQAQDQTGAYHAGGYAQLTLEPIYDDDREGLKFGADRVRLHGGYERGPWFGQLELSLNDDNFSARPPGTLPLLIADLYFGYQLAPELALSFGQFKIPVGMDFLIPGDRLDLVKRGMDAALVLDRSLGAMISGRGLARYFGFDFGIFNPAGRSIATLHQEEQVGDVNAVAARITFDAGERLHAEASLGYSPLAGGESDTRNYIVANSGLRYSHGAWTGKFEYTAGFNVRGGENVAGSEGQDQQVLQLHLGYRAAPWLDWVGRIYLGGSKTEEGNTTLQNTFFGANLYLDPNRRHNRVQLQYILTTGDEQLWSGVGGFLSDTIFLQFQAGFDFAS